MNRTSPSRSMKLRTFLQLLESGDWQWFAKRLSGNDTGLTGGHQVGIYLPRHFVQVAFPEIDDTNRKNPDTTIHICFFASHGITTENLRVVYYNNKYFPDSRKSHTSHPRDEFRITRWGGRESPVQDHENTGSILLFAVTEEKGQRRSVCWCCRTIEEELEVEAWLGEELEPGRLISSADSLKAAVDEKRFRFPAHWLSEFPSGLEIFEFVKSLIPYDPRNPDGILLKRRDTEFQVFRELEKIDVLPKIKDGFNSVDHFLELALSIANRRKSRTGRSLELNLQSVFTEEKLEFEAQAVTENRKQPDFLFPSGRAYHDPGFPEQALRMMAAKTCCKDRWRQVLDEAARIRNKHLFTLQQGISENQLNQMYEANLTLVVPRQNIKQFPRNYRSHILTLRKFISEIKSIQGIDS